MSERVFLSADKLIILLDHSKRVGTQDACIDLAKEWIKYANNEIVRLESIIQDAIEQINKNTQNLEKLF